MLLVEVFRSLVRPAPTADEIPPPPVEKHAAGGQIDGAASDLFGIQDRLVDRVAPYLGDTAPPSKLLARPSASCDTPTANFSRGLTREFV